jgi:hypothetical protein
MEKFYNYSQNNTTSCIIYNLIKNKFPKIANYKIYICDISTNDNNIFLEIGYSLCFYEKSNIIILIEDSIIDIPNRLLNYCVIRYNSENIINCCNQVFNIINNIIYNKQKRDIQHIYDCIIRI